jgi:hypothetical protein
MHNSLMRPLPIAVPLCVLLFGCAPTATQSSDGFKPMLGVLNDSPNLVGAETPEDLQKFLSAAPAERDSLIKEGKVTKLKPKSLCAEEEVQNSAARIYFFYPDDRQFKGHYWVEATAVHPAAKSGGATPELYPNDQDPYYLHTH